MNVIRLSRKIFGGEYLFVIRRRSANAAFFWRIFGAVNKFGGYGYRRRLGGLIMTISRQWPQN
jgi:hypothetical protein